MGALAWDVEVRTHLQGIVLWPSDDAPEKARPLRPGNPHALRDCANVETGVAKLHGPLDEPPEILFADAPTVRLEQADESGGPELGLTA
jgi:hypothetical protein